MGKQKHGRHRAQVQRHRTGSMVAVGAVPLVIAVVGAGAATADPTAAPAQVQPAVTPVAAPIAPPPGKIRMGEQQIGTPYFIDEAQAKAINDGAAGAEAQTADFYIAQGVDPVRAQNAAATTIGDAAVGATVATLTVGLPLAAAGGLVGGVAGLIAGVPFLPAGLVVGPPLGAAIGAVVTAAPFTALGGAIGAGVGAARGLSAPPAPAPAG